MREIAGQVSQYDSLAKFPADAVGNTRNDMYLASEAIRNLMKDKGSSLDEHEDATLRALPTLMESGGIPESAAF